VEGSPIGAAFPPREQVPDVYEASGILLLKPHTRSIQTGPYGPTVTILAFDGTPDSLIMKSM
jgi:hypothetical protein